MDVVLESSWRTFPAFTLMMAGGSLAFAAARGELLALRASNAATPLAFVRGFRVCVIGLALLALGISWMWGILWLAVLALIIGAEETFETTLLIFGLTRGAQLRLRP